MKIHVLLLVCALCLSVAAPLRCAWGDGGPVRVNITKPLTPLGDVLAALAQQTGQTILTDDTVVAPIGVASLQAANVGEMLTKLKALDPGLSWHKVSLPQDAPLPSGTDLSAQVRALETVSASGLVVASPTSVLTFSRRADASAAPPAGMRAVYLVTDETVRAQRQAKASADAKPQDAGQAQTPVAQTSAGMQGVADTFSQMTPDQQRQALPMMMAQFVRIMQNMDPSVRDQLRQQFGQMRGQGGFGGPGNGQ